jgi:hypothetical protein
MADGVIVHQQTKAGQTTGNLGVDISFPNTLPQGEEIACVEVTVVCGVPSTHTQRGMYQRRAMFGRTGGAPVLYSTVQVIGTDYETTAGMNVDIKSDGSAGFDVTVTGVSATTIGWAVAVRVTTYKP